MKPDYKNALALYLEKSSIALPSSGEKWALYNGMLIPDLDDRCKSALICEQGFRTDYLRLEQSGYEVVSRFETINEQYSTAIILLGRVRRINEQNIIRAWNACKEGGRIIVAGDKTSGVSSLRKWAADLTELTDSFSKFHAMVFSIEKTGKNQAIPALTSQIDGYEISSGMFSSDGPDEGSKLLTEYFPSKIYGRVADLGAGWGYLSGELLKHSEKISSLHLYEADFLSLEAARVNLEKTEVDNLQFNWCDVTTEFKKQVYDWVIMNPPFHTGRAAEPGLGKKFIQVAASTLPSGGRLLMVANRNLPYEEVLSKAFRKFDVLEVRDGFKVIEARK